MSLAAIEDKWYFTGKPCKNGHIAPRLKSNRTCKDCSYAKRQSYETSAVYTEWKVANKKQVCADWQKRNRGSVNANTRKYQTAKLFRSPSWLTDFDILKIKCLYQLAAMRTRESGESWHVDHIIPLQGRKVSGLHVPSNLTVIRGQENVRKSNKFDQLALSSYQQDYEDEEHITMDVISGY